MIYPDYVWMTYGWYSERWWNDTANMTDLSCSSVQLESAIERSLSFHHFPLPTQDEEDAPTDVNYVS